MLPAKRRVKKESFTEIMKEGVFVSGQNLYLRFKVKNGSTPSLFAFVVPNKVEKTSVGRHLLKRRLSGVVEKLLIDVKSGTSIIFMVKNNFSLLSSIELEKEIYSLLKRANLLK